MLHYCITHNHPEAIKELAYYNADLMMTNRENQTPLEHARFLNNQACVNTLIDAIKKKITLLQTKPSCGLVKHLPINNNNICDCSQSLKKQLQY